MKSCLAPSIDRKAMRRLFLFDFKVGFGKAPDPSTEIQLLASTRSYKAWQRAQWRHFAKHNKPLLCAMHWQKDIENALILVFKIGFGKAPNPNSETHPLAWTRRKRLGKKQSEGTLWSKINSCFAPRIDRRAMRSLFLLVFTIEFGKAFQRLSMKQSERNSFGAKKVSHSATQKPLRW